MLVWLLAHLPGPQSGETPHWWPLITSIANGHGYEACFPEYFPGCGAKDWPTAAREPVPAFLFAGVARLTGGSLFAASLIQMLISLLVLLALLLLAREIAGKRCAFWAGLLWIFYLPALKLIPQVSGELLAGLGVVSGLYFYLMARRTGLRLHWFAAGLALAMASLSRSSSLVIILALIPLAFVGIGPSIRRRLASTAAFLAGMALALLPWAGRNLVELGSPVLGSTLEGYNLYRQNHQLETSDYLRFVGGSEALKAVEEMEQQHPELMKASKEEEMDKLYEQQGLRTILHHSKRYLLLSGYRFLPLWFDWGYLQAYGVSPRLPDYLVMLQQALFLPLAVLGLFRLGRRAVPLAIAVAAICLIHMAVIAQLRYLVPVMPLVMILTAAGFLSQRRAEIGFHRGFIRTA